MSEQPAFVNTAVSAVADVEIEPPRDEDYGPRTCHVNDPWGDSWYFWQGDAIYP